MSKNTLCDVIKNLELWYQLSPYQQKKFEEYVSYVEPGDLIYPGQLKSKLVINIEKAYQILEELKKQGFLINRYEIYCHDCGKSTGKFIDSLEEFNQDIYCDFCGKKFFLDENIIVLYKVVHI